MMLYLQHEALGGLDAAITANRPDAAIASNSVRMLTLQYTHRRDAAKPASVSVFRMLRLQHRGPDAEVAAYLGIGRDADIAANQTDAVNATW